MHSKIENLKINVTFEGNLMGLRDYVTRRAVEVVILIILATSLNFFIFRLMPGNPAARFIENPRFDMETRRMLLRRFGLDKPLWEQFLIYFRNAFTGEFGMSFSYFRPVWDVIFSRRLINTIILMSSSTILSMMMGLIVGVIASWKRGTKLDVGSLITSLVLYSLPVFFLGMLIILVFAYYWYQWFGSGLIPFAGTITRGLKHANVLQYVADYLWHLIPPMLTLASINFGLYFLIMRNTMLDILTQDYMLTARAVGLDNKTVLFSYAMRNAMLPLITIVAINLAFVVSGAVLTETVFSWYGMGRLIYLSVMEHDYPVLEGAFWLISVLVLIANFLADIVYAYLDPRIKY
ncbi:MAG: ABC transporter permease [Candidatus Bathyarchaeia archaeon]